jgi:serine/threonine protein kinase/Tol biopolymer transport system component
MAGQAARTLRPEDEISHYRIVGPLGAGGMGEVYLARDRSLDRSVALKILPPDLVKSEERVRRFELEARSASSLNHPNIVTIYEIGQDAVRSTAAPDSAPVRFISMELVSGKTLSTLIHEDETDLRTLLGYLAQAAEGLAKAHAAGIVHRDLKPGNIMVTADGFAKVLDFGLAKLTEKKEAPQDITNAPTLGGDISGVGTVIGTASYMSPEQVQGRAVDHRSDIFSFGCLLYEAATRRQPFAAETAVETMHKILNEKPPPVEETNDKVPAELRRLIRRCLAKSPDQRLQSIKDLAIELREIVDEYDTLSASASSSSSASGPRGPAVASGRGRPALAAGAAVALMALLGLALAWWGLWRGRGEGPTPPFQSMRMTTQTTSGDVVDCAVSPDGRYLAYLAGPEGHVGLRVRQVATGSDVEVLPPTDAGLKAPAFSPDGNYLFYLRQKPDARMYRALFQVPSLGGNPQERTFDVDSRVSFSPDGKQVAFWRGVPQKEESTLVIFDLDEAKGRVLATVPSAEVFQGAPAWSPDGRRIAAALLKPAPDLQSSIVLFDAVSGEKNVLLELPRTFLTSIAWLHDGRGLAISATDFKATLSEQLFLAGYPDARVQRITNDFNQYSGVSVSAQDEAIAAVRETRLANLWLADAAGGAVRQITRVSSPENSPGGFAVLGDDTVVYSAPLDQSVQIWAAGMAGGETRALTSGPALSVSPKAAGGVIVFARLDSSGVHIWRMRADGSDIRQMTSGAGEQLGSLSPDGRFVSFSAYEDLQTVSVLSLEDGKVSRIATQSGGAHGFSPDSRRLLVSRLEPDAQGLINPVWEAFPVAGGKPVARFRLPGSATDPEWTPDGRGMSFRDTTDPHWNVFRQDGETARPTPVTRFTEGRVVGYSWSPDGRKLAVIRRLESGSNVWVTEADGRRPVPVTQFTSADVFDVRWLDDSRRLVTSAGRRSRDAVLVRDFR